MRRKNFKLYLTINKYKQNRNYFPMRTLIFIISFIFITSQSLFSQLPDKHLKPMVLDNDVKSITQWNHKFKDGKPARDGYKNAYKEFDENGNVTKEIYFRQGDINQELSYKYDHNQQKTKYENYDASNDEVSFRQIIDYDDDGKKIKEERYNGSEHFEINYNYDNQGNLTEILKKKREKSGASVTYELEEKRIYNRDGNTVTIEVLTPDDILLKKIINKHDDQGNLIEFNEYDENDNRLKKISYEYNDENQKIKEVKHQRGNFIYEKQYQYNNQNNVAEIQTEEPKGEVYISKVFDYDDNNNLIKEMRYEPRADKYSKKIFSYDEDNLLQEVEVYYAVYDYKIQYKFDYEYH